MKKKVLLIASILFLAIGFATISTSLVLNGTVFVNPGENDYRIYFSDAKENGVRDLSLITNDTNINFETDLTNPGDKFVLDYTVKNDSSTFNAKVNIEVSGSNKCLKVENTFDSEAILAAKQSRTGKLVVTLLGKSTEDTSYNVNVKLVVESTYDEVIAEEDPFDNSSEERFNAYTVIKKQVKSGATIDFTQEEFGEGSIYSTRETQSGKEVYFYRGNSNNNVIFNDKCWQIIRTTETGGVKMIYAGSPVAGYRPVEIDEYSYTNDNTYPYEYKNGKWSSTNSADDDSTSVMTITGLSGNYAVYYHASGIGRDPFSINLGTKNIVYSASNTEGYKIMTNVTPSQVLKISFKNGERDDYHLKYNTDYGEFQLFKLDNSSATACVPELTRTAIGANYYNENSDDNAYVGYMYGQVGATSYEAAHANTTNSLIKTEVDEWYRTNIANKPAVAAKIEDTVYCNDRSTKAYDPEYILSLNYAGYTDLGYGKNKTLYSAASRTWIFSKHPSPTLTCKNENDRFTVSSEIGNGKLTYPVGLITADEATFAGFVTGATVRNPALPARNDNMDYIDTTNTYLYTGGYFYTMTPIGIGGSSAYMGCINEGHISGQYLNVDRDIRPVISLKAGTMFSSGDGTSRNPYVVDMN